MSAFKSLYDLNFFAVLLTGCFFLFACNNKEVKTAKITAAQTGIEVAKKVVIKYSVGGKRKAFLTGPIMYRVQDTASYIEFPKTLHVDFYNEADSIDSRLDAHYAKYRDNQSIVFLKDSVKITNITGDTLYCNELFWDRARTGVEFYTGKPVRIRTRTQIIDGIGMESGQDFKNWHIIQPVGFVKVPSSQFPN